MPEPENPGNEDEPQPQNHRDPRDPRNRLDANPLIKPFVVLALPGMYLFYKYNQYKRKRKENATRRLAEKELLHLNNKISADVILLLPTQDLKEDTPLGERIMKEGERICRIVKECTVFAPRAILVSCVPPVSVTTSICANIFKKTHFYHPGRIIGSAAITQVKANTLLARYNDLDPLICNVPLIGGPDTDLAVPLYSRAKPVEAIGKGSQILTAKLRGIPEDDFPKILGKPNFVQKCDMAEAHALNCLVSTIGLGVCGDSKALANVYVRSNIVQTCGHLVSTVRFARGGVVHNFGIPQLTKFELDLLEKATLEIKEREKMADEFVEFMKNNDNKKMPEFVEKEDKEQQLLKQTFVK